VGKIEYEKVVKLTA
jgi:protein disulfide-isomerase-like protein